MKTKKVTKQPTIDPFDYEDYGGNGLVIFCILIIVFMVLFAVLFAISLWWLFLQVGQLVWMS